MTREQQLQAYLAKLEHDPESREAHEALAGLAGSEEGAEEVFRAARDVYAEREDWEGLLGLYRSMLSGLAEPRLQSRVWYQIGQLEEGPLGQPGEAIQAYQEAFQADPSDVRPLHAARALYRQYGQLDAVGHLLGIELQVVTEGEESALLWTELGYLQMRHLEDSASARESFREALARAPGLAEAHAGLEEAMAGGNGANGEAEASLEVEALEPIDPVTAETQPIELLGRPLPSEADSQELEAVEPILETLDSLELEAIAPENLVSEGEPPRPVQVTTEVSVEALALAQEELVHARVTAEYEIKPPDVAAPAAEPGRNGASHPDVEAAVAGTLPEADVLDVASLAETGAAGGPPEPAEPELAEPEPAEPEPEPELEAIELEAAEAVDAPQAAPEPPKPEKKPEVRVERSVPSTSARVERSFEDWVAMAEQAEGEAAARYLVSAVSALDKPRDRGLVRDAFERILASGGDAVRHVDAIRPALLGDAEGWEGVLEVLSQHIEGGGGARYERAAYEAAFYGLGDYERAKQLGGAESDASEVVEAAKVGNWRKVHLDLAAAATKAGESNPELVALVGEANLAMGLGKTEKAIDSLRKLSRTATLERSTSGLLKALYRADEKWNPLIDVLKKEVEGAPKEEQVELLREMVRIYREKLNLDVMVVQTYNAILKIQPHDRESLEALSAKLEEMRRYPDLVDVLRKRADAAETPEERTRLLLQVAQLYVDKFSNQAEAVKAYEGVLDVDGENQEAIEFLSKMYRQRGDWQKLVDIRRRFARFLEDGEQRAGVLAEIANVAFDRLRDPDLSEKLWIEVLTLQPGNDEGLAALTKVYERQKNWEPLANVLEKRLAHETGDAVKKELLDKLGALYADRLGQRERAVEAYEQLMALEPDNRRAADSLKKSYIELMWWDRLEAFYAKQDAWAEYVRILETLAGTQKDPAVTVELLFRSANVWLERLDGEARAVRALERILSVDAANKPAADRLAGFYEAQGNHRKLREVLQVLLDAQTEAEPRFELLVRLARLTRQLKDVAASFGYYGEAVETMPSRNEILDEVEEVTREVGRWRELEQVYRRALQRAGETGAEQGAAEQLTLRLGRVLDAELQQVDEALTCFHGVLDTNSASRPAIEALISIYHRLNDNESLLDMYDRLFGLAADADERVHILQQIADIHEVGRGDAASAVEKHLQVLNEVGVEHPDHRQSLEALHRLYRQQEDWSSLVGVIQKQIDADAGSAPERAIDLYCELGQVSLHQLRDVKAALDAYEKVLAQRPKDEMARRDLEALLDDEKDALLACAILEPIYTAEEGWTDLVRVLEIRLARQKQTKKALPERKALLGRIVDLHAHQRADQRAAFEASTRLLALDPADESVRTRLEGFAAGAQPAAWADLVEVYAERLLGLREGELDEGQRELAGRYAFRLAQIADTELGDLERAIESYRTTLELLPEHRPALDALADLFTRTKRWPELLEVHRRQIQLSQDPEEIRVIRFSIAVLHEDMLDEPSEAVATYLEDLQDRPDDREALQALDRLYARLERYEDLAQNLGRQIALAEEGSDDWCRLMCWLAEIQETQLGDTPRAVEIYRDVLQRRRDDGEAARALERLLENPAVAGEASRILSPLYETAGDVGKLVHALEIELEHTEDPARRLALFHRVAGLYETGLGHPRASFETLLSAVGEAPLDEPTQDALYRLAEELNTWSELADRYHQLAGELDDANQASVLYVRLARLSEERLSDLERAAGYWREVLARNPGERVAVLALELLYQQLNQWEPLVEVLLMKVDLPELQADLRARKEVYFQVTTLYEDILGLKDQAISIMETVVDLDDKDARALDQLKRLYRETERWHDLIENANRRLALATTDEERRAIWYEMGQIYDERLQEPEQSIGVYRQVLDVFPGDPVALEALDRLYESTENWAARLENLERRRSLAETPEAKRALRYDAGRLLQERLTDVSQAIDVYAEVLREDASFLAARESLEALLQEGQETERVAKVLDPLYRGAGEWRKLIAMYELMVQEATSAEERAGDHRQIADIYEHELYDLAGAFDSLSKSLREVPNQGEIAERLERLARSLMRWPELVTLLSALREEASDPQARIDLGKRSARILEVELSAVPSAIEAYNAVVAIDPNDLDSLRALHRLYERATQWSELAGVIEREIDLCANESEAVPLRQQLGTLFGEVLEEPERAVEAFNRILAIAPGNAEAIGSLEAMFQAGTLPLEIAPILEPIYAERQDWVKLVDLKLAMLQHQESADQRFATLCDAGEIAINKMEDDGAALTIYGQALCERPGDESIGEKLGQLADKTQAYGDLAAIYRAALETEPDPFDAQRLSLRLARTLYDNLGNVEGALDWFRYTLQLDPANREALAALDEIDTRLERWPELAEVLRREREQAMSDDELVTYGFRLASLYENQLTDLDAATTAYNEVLDANPTHRDALAALESIHQRRNQWEELFVVYDRQSTLAQTEDERAAIYERMAELAMSSLDRPEEAIDLWNQVLGIHPQDDHALASLEFLYESTERLPDLVEVLERRAALSQDAETQRAIWEKIGRVWRALDNGERAVEAYKRLLELSPGNPDALFALRQLYEQSGDSDSLARTLASLIEHGYLRDSALLDAYLRLGELYGDVLGRPAQAIEAWRAVLQLKPGDELALDQLERLYLDGQHWVEAVDVLEQKLKQSWDPGVQADLVVRIAELWQGQVKDLDRAAEAWERLLALEPANEQAAMALESIYQQQQNWDRLVEIYLGRIDHLPDLLDRLTVLRSAAGVFEEKKQEPEGAFLVMAKAFKEDPLDPETAGRLERLAEVTDNWSLLVELYADTIGEVAARGVDQTLDLHQRLAGYYHQKVGRPELAEVHYHKVLDIDPSNEVALAALEQIYEVGGGWQELVGTLKRRLDLPIDPTEQVELYLKIGSIQEQRIGSPDEAVHAYKMVLRVDENNLAALSALERIYEARGAWRELIDVLERRAGITYEPELAVELKYRIGQLWQHQLQVPERAIEVYRDILTIDQSYIPALDALQVLYVAQAKWDRYLDVLEIRLSLNPPDAERIEILQEMARIHRDQMGEPDRAVEAYRQVLDIAPGRVDALRDLYALYAQAEYWDDLAFVLGEQIDKIQDPRVQVEFLAIQGGVARDYLGDMFRAIQSFQRVLSIDQNHHGALTSLAGLYEEVGQWEDCIEVYNRLILAAEDVPTRTQLLCRVGKIYEQNILNDELALERFQTALDLDPGCQEAMLELRELYLKREDWPQAVQIIKRQIDYSRDLSEKSALLAEIGSINEERLGDPTTAMEYYEQAIELDPNNVVAAAPLAEECLRTKKWARAIPLLKVLVESDAYKSSSEGLHLLHYNLGMANEELDKEDEALRHYREAHELERSHLPTLEGLSRIYLKRDEMERAFRILEDLMTHHGHSMEPEKLAELYAQQGEMKLRVGERSAAQDLFQKALLTNPNDLAALRQMIDLLQKQENWGQAVEYLMRLTELPIDPIEQFKVLVDAGDIYKDKLGQVEQAIECYKAAVEVDPNSKVVLERLLKIFTATENWKRATEVLGKLAALEEHPERHAKICLTIAYILRDHLNDTERAVTFFNRTLDAHFQFLEAFQAIDAILTSEKSWDALQKNYRKMIKRVTDADDGSFEALKLMLWENLGEIYRSRLESYEEAIAAFKIAAHLAPEKAKNHEILAELYEKVSGHEGDAINEHHELIKVSPFRFESYRALFERYIQLKDYDAAWCLAGALALLEKANEKERQVYEKYLATKLPVAKKQLTNEQWAVVYHPEESQMLGNIMAMWSNYLRHAYSYDLKQNWKVHKKKDLLDLSQQLMFSKLFNYAVRVLGVPPSNVYVKRDQIGGIQNANADPPALIVGADMLTGREERELTFHIGKALTLMRPEHYLGGAFPVTDKLKKFFWAAMQVTQPSAQVPAADPEVDHLTREMQKMPHVLVAIQKVTKKLLDAQENPNYTVWLKALDYTSDRVGLLLCGDLRQAVNAVKSEGITISKATTKDRIRELVLWGVSKQYLALRKELGLAIGTAS